MSGCFSTASSPPEEWIWPTDDLHYKEWASQWMVLQKWVFQERFFRNMLKIGEGGEIGQNNRILEETFKRTGVSIMGKRMSESGEHFWPEEDPSHTPVFDGVDRGKFSVDIVETIHSPWSLI